MDDKLFPNILAVMNKRMMRADVPLNLAATSMIANAYMYTGDEKYRQWIEQYVEAWMKTRRGERRRDPRQHRTPRQDWRNHGR